MTKHRFFVGFLFSYFSENGRSANTNEPKIQKNSLFKNPVKVINFLLNDHLSTFGETFA